MTFAALSRAKSTLALVNEVACGNIIFLAAALTGVGNSVLMALATTSRATKTRSPFLAFFDVRFRPTNLTSENDAGSPVWECDKVRDLRMLSRMTRGAKNLDVGRIIPKLWMMRVALSMMAMQMLGRAASFASLCLSLPRGYSARDAGGAAANAASPQIMGWSGAEVG